jgi:hypothetical protein
MTRTALTGVRDEGNRLGWRPIAPPWKSESVRLWRLLAGPVCARSLLGLASILGQAADRPPFRRAKRRRGIAVTAR